MCNRGSGGGGSSQLVEGEDFAGRWGEGCTPRQGTARAALAAYIQDCEQVRDIPVRSAVHMQCAFLQEGVSIYTQPSL